jgi:acetyl esterase/lipase
VFFFGGGWRRGTPGQFLPQSLHLSQRGMVAIVVDYRVESRQGVLPQECVRDAKAAIRWVRANASRLGIDPDRIVAGGGSAGGHLAAATALVPGFEDDADSAVSSMPNAIVLFNPAVVLAPVEGQPDLLPADKVAAYQTRTDGRPEEISPYHFVRGGLPPSIIFHGTKDDAVPFPTVVSFQKAMTAAGNRCELKAYEGQSHGFFNLGRGEGEARAEATRNFDRTMSELDVFLESLGYLTAAAKPNILLIVADDLGWSDVGWHGGFGKTPVMDRLVSEGVELDQHYVQPVCTPTRAALMSGRYPGRFGPQALSPSNLRAMPLGTVTLASRCLRSSCDVPAGLRRDTNERLVRYVRRDGNCRYSRRRNPLGCGDARMADRRRSGHRRSALITGSQPVDAHRPRQPVQLRNLGIAPHQNDRSLHANRCQGIRQAISSRNNPEPCDDAGRVAERNLHGGGSRRWFHPDLQIRNSA